ncbi:MAG: PAS domain S-box protein [Labilithrix sp.]|nr:PAS domain S-box protein [Labilithrix sp.]
MPGVGEKREEHASAVDAPFRAVIEASPIPFALNDEHANITYLNPEFVRTFGYAREDIPTLADWWPRAYPDPAYRAWVIAEWNDRFEEAQRTGLPFAPMELIVCGADGSPHDVIAYAASLGTAMSGTHLVVLYDITKERRLAEEQRRLQDHLSQAQRLESIGRLAGGIAHDFNNMLGVILGRTEIALKHVDPSGELHAHLGEIRDAARRSAELTRQLLAYGGRQSGAPRVIDPNEAIEGSMHVLRLIVGETVTLRWRPQDDIWLVKIDLVQLDQILTNLCANARDAIADAGEVTVRTENATLSHGDFAVGEGLAPGEYMVIEVADDGAGIQPDVLRHLFEPFFTTKQADKGHGLGLSTVYGIARQNDGGVSVASTVGRGSVFRVYLPRAVPDR